MWLAESLRRRAPRRTPRLVHVVLSRGRFISPRPLLARTAINPATYSCYSVSLAQLLKTIAAFRRDGLIYPPLCNFVSPTLQSTLLRKAVDPVPLVGTLVAGQPEMRANAKPAAAPGDGAPGSEYPALIKMSNKHTKLSQARSEEPAPPKLNDQHNTHPMPVRAQVPWPEHAN